jgi:hypothetical protein
VFLANSSVLMLDVARFPDSFRRPPTCTPPVMEIRSAQRAKNPPNARKVGYTIRWYRMCCRCCSTPLQGSPGTGTASGYKEMARCMLPAVARRVPVQHALWVAMDAGRCKFAASYCVSSFRVQWEAYSGIWAAPKTTNRRMRKDRDNMRWLNEPRGMHMFCLI